MPKYRANFVIAAYEGLKVDWLYFITDGLKDAIGDLVGAKKPWAGVAQWLSVLDLPSSPLNLRKEFSRKRHQRRQPNEDSAWRSTP